MKAVITIGTFGASLALGSLMLIDKGPQSASSLRHLKIEAVKRAEAEARAVAQAESPIVDLAPSPAPSESLDANTATNGGAAREDDAVAKTAAHADEEAPLTSVRQSRRKRAIAAYNKAANYDDLYEYDQSVRLYRKAIHLLPKFYQAHSNLGGVLIKMGRFDEAARSLNRALEIKPNDHISIMVKSQIWKVQGEYDRALQVLDECFQLARQGQVKPKDEFDCRHRRAHYYDKADRWKESYAEFAQLARERPDDFDLLYSRCLLSLRLEEYDRGKAEFRFWKKAAEIRAKARGGEPIVVDWRLSRVQEMIDAIEAAEERQRAELRFRRWPPWTAEAWRELMSKHPPRETRIGWWILTSQ